MTTVVVLATAAAVSLLLLFAHNSRHEAAATGPSLHSSTPVDHAERILAGRYARGQITASEYQRMLAILRT
jgi:uncharacterized membrane protein